MSTPVEIDELRARLDTAERHVRTLAEAVRVLAGGLEGGPLEEAGRARPEHAARLAHELLLAAGLIRAGEGSQEPE
ncbi:hypothetical protein GCM10010116_36070 [Microbispora rosea subsp. aerata]|nr:hypothetical protein [Microbispora rosea]GGO17856.1 hypothetical protein GCM10010116_36070 [Microbispora rosea subsp. aerata]GIH56621.1 hypothetical protein Mro02_35350 [Microbispora rosea subsp. aerata]GLJ81850.1 hypothetical protein GCM10017588_05750 [Microbispora rosea subsp. aerata]